MAFHGIDVIDFHAHFPTQKPGYWGAWRSRMIEKYGEEKLNILMDQSKTYRDIWRKKWLFDPPETEPHTDEQQAARWIEDIDKKRIQRVNFVTGGGNDNLAKIVMLYPDRFTGFAHHDIFSEDAPAELERAVKKLNLRGFKMIASSLYRPIDDEFLYPFWETAESLEIPILVHFGVLGGGGGPPSNHHNMNPLVIEEVAKMFPKLRFVIPHFGAGYLRELLLLCWSCPNVYVDTSGSNQWMAWMPFDLDLKALFRKMMETIGPERLIFGTDSSYFPRGFSIQYLEDQLKICRQIGIDEKSIEKIFHDNAAKLLKLE
ncbi:amidohydrolase [Candidatus Bathyarchaeota archaeon]|nr:amidohydrolase [Candidatus Bathyarchaeota archaeon]MBS7631039.1 amidohydrolase [Candidatus Bathyarchaeota archaeon]